MDGDQGVGREVKRLREARGWSQTRLAAEAGMSVSGVSMIESGHRNLTTTTLAKLAGALGVEVRDLFPLGQAPLPDPPGTSEAEERLAKVPEVLGDYIMSRMEDYEAELEAPDSPHFRTATSATLWLADLEKEVAAWTDWIVNEAVKIMPLPRSEAMVAALIDVFGNAFQVVGFMLSFYGLKEEAEKRIKAMNDLPDDLAARRLEKAAAEAEASMERLEEFRKAASG
jgi:transcriptional regulator with XRE-family HTH domain